MSKITLKKIVNTINDLSSTPSKPIKKIYTFCGGKLTTKKERIIEFITFPEPLTAIYRWDKDEEEKKSMEKDRMKNEVIRKLHAKNDKLESKINRNEQEIKNLKDTLDGFEDRLK